MPDLRTSIHIDMLKDYRRRNLLPLRLLRALGRELRGKPIYGLEWGDPETVAPLGYVRDHFLTPYVGPDVRGLEIGAGGGRWTRYMLDLKSLTIVDYHQELLDQLQRTYDRPNMRFVKNDGSDLPGVADESIDFLWSFGVFVHLDAPIIESYLAEIARVLAPGGNAVLQYSDKTKPMGRDNPGFSDNDPARMVAMVEAAGLKVVEQDDDTLWHSGVVRIQR